MIPEQRPDPAPRYRFRPRSDRYDFPRFTGPVELDADRYEADYRDPEPLTWDDLKDPANLIGGLLVFIAIVVFILGVSIQDIR